MNFSLTQSQLAIKSQFSEFASSHLNQDVEQRHRDGSFPAELWKLCGKELGIQGLPVDPGYGGRGFDALETVAALEGLGYGCEDGGLTFALAAQLLSCIVPVWLYGSDAQKKKYLPGLCDGELVASNAMTEAQGGSAAFAMNCEARPIPGGYRLSGVKSYCANAPIADVCIAYLLTDKDKGFFGGVSAFLLDRDKHGFAVNNEIDKLGLRTCTTGKIILDGVEVQAEDLLGKRGAGSMIFSHSMDWERVGMSALHIGTITRLLERAVSYARQRKPGGVAISRYQAVSHTLADIQTELRAAQLLVYSAASILANGTNANREASMAKLFTSECFKSTTLKLMQLYAGAGYAADSEISRVLQDSLASTVYSGTSEVQRNIIAGWMGC